MITHTHIWEGHSGQGASLAEEPTPPPGPTFPEALEHSSLFGELQG